MMPFVFILTRGAASGFHGLVSSGTTAKQLDRKPMHGRSGMAVWWARASWAFWLFWHVPLDLDPLRNGTPTTIRSWRLKAVQS